MEKLRLLLVNPPKLNAVIAEYDRPVYSNFGYKLPVQLLFLARYIEDKLPDVKVDILDTQAAGLNHEESVRAIAAYDPQVIGITSWTEFWCDTHLLIDGLKQRLPRAHICIGGINAGIYPEIVLANKNVDSVVCGYGEEPLEQLLRILMGKPGEKVDGLYLKDDLKRVSEFKWNSSVGWADCRPLPRSKMLRCAYHSLLSRGPAATLITSRGCPFACVYCRVQSQRFSAYPVDFVVNEFRSVYAMGIREAEIYDDTFTVSKERTQEICRRLISEKIKISWSIRDRVTNNDPGLLLLMKKAGLKMVSYGIETASDATLERIKKGITLADIRKAVKNAKSAGLTVMGYFMIGLPGDTRKDFQDISDLSMELGIDYANYSSVIAYPGTELYAAAITKGILAGDVWRKYVERPFTGMQMPLYTEACSRDELNGFVNACYKRFYFRKKIILREVMKVGSFREFARKTRLALDMAAQR